MKAGGGGGILGHLFHIVFISVSPVLSPSPLEPPIDQSHDQSHDQAGLHDNSIPAEDKVEANGTTLVGTSVMEEKVSSPVPMENHNTEMAVLSPAEEQELVEKWSKILGPEYQVKVSWLLLPGVVTNVSPVEAFATRMKVETNDYVSFKSQSKDQGDLGMVIQIKREEVCQQYFLCFLNNFKAVKS